MTTPAIAGTASPLDLTAIRRAVDTVLEEFLQRKAHTAASGHLPGEVTQVLHDFLFAGGKRLRPLLCVTGWHAAAGHGDTTPVIRTAASLELFHAFALIHDDLMDRSATRRGHPTVHRALAARYHGGRSSLAAEHLGTSGAILVGDLALTWSDELLHTARVAPGRLAAVLPVIDTMRTEVMYGQYLDLLATGDPTDDLDTPLTVIRYKTAKYTVERPLHTGAVLADARPGAQAALTAFALPAGEAFQLRDDLLGVFGDPAVTGKSHLDDLREGKHTALMAMALRQADHGQATQLHALVGDPQLDDQGAATVRDILTATGARSAIEQMISLRHRQALSALDTDLLSPAAATTLRSLTDSLIRRSR
ncbi:polyprenyl synthetase family protein [Streptomyces sp. NRRL B-1347]|uniref:polyprenyl synthetase family protein n=1 Tax=Streptomyces sp. NRRL B-1347 TaxID=1476877 RepID=UPI0004CA86AE|nr:polyprenyl synthetase family protein [Streptomyces sp. NRRL B-1347]